MWAIEGAKKHEARLHLPGIASFHGSRGSIDRLLGLFELAKREGLKAVHNHSMLGHRGEHPESGARYMQLVEEATERLRLGKVVSVIGRF